MKAQGYFSVVIYNDGDIDKLVKDIGCIDNALCNFVNYYEIIIVENTIANNNIYEVLCSVKEDIKGNIILVNLSYSHNKDSAMKAGVDISIGDYVYEIESVNQHTSYDQLEDMYKKLISKRCDIVFLRPYRMKGVNKWVSNIIKIKGNRKISLGQGSIKLITRRGLNAADICHEEDSTRNIDYQLCGLKSTTMYSYVDNKNGLSYLIKEIAYVFRCNRIGIKLAYIIAGIYLCLCGIHIVNNKIGDKYLIPIILFSFSMLLVIMGILLDYLLLIIREMRERKSYIVQEVKRVK